MTVRVTDTFWHLQFFSTVTFEFEVTQGGFRVRLLWYPQLFISFSFEPQRLTEDGVTVRASFVLPPSHFDEEEHPWSTWQSPVLPLRDLCHDCPLLRQLNTCSMC